MGIIAMDMLPELLWTTDIAGHVTTKAAAETALKSAAGKEFDRQQSLLESAITRIAVAKRS